ncbi:hypothetical protein [Halapricum desulfuricans]|uniref:Metallophosphoesterase n=1 Tax=Halapricum desulfuricans TaxID=2841257 RepID=A0A897N2A5_9EURY|nr:hypothetical protein [Halapricum desulfuricans]QSG06348.1 hypothetical protein HSR121_2015 [Halapricum desulfuricans]
MTNLTKNQKKAVEAMPATAREIADVLNYASTSGVYDLLRRAERRDSTITFSSENGVWDYQRVEAEKPVVTDGGTATAPGTRIPTVQKQTITKDANDFLSELEVELRDRLAAYDPVDTELPVRPGHRDMVMFRTDDHFGDQDTEVALDGEVIETFSSEIAAERVFQHRDHILSWKAVLEDAGYTFDTVHLLMNGDHVTNESIYESQPHYIDQRLRGQVRLASEVYVDVIRSLAEEFPAVQVVCQHGNHGELRARGASHEANADDLLYDAIDLALRQSDLDNVRFVTNHVDTHTEFLMRGHRGYMRHGQDGLGHIGTTSGVKKWQSWLLESIDRNGDTGWDVGYWGHFHELKIEPVNGRPVLMGGTLEPAGDYENALGIAPGRPGAWCHTVSDEEAIDQLKPVYFS